MMKNHSTIFNLCSFCGLQETFIIYLHLFIVTKQNWFNVLHLHLCNHKETTCKLLLKVPTSSLTVTILSLASKQHQIRRPMMNRKMETMLWYLVAVVILVAKGRWLRSQDRLVRRCQWCMDQSLQYEGCAICLMSRHLSHLCIIFRTFHDYSQHQLLTKQSCILSSVHSSSATSSNHTISKFFSIRACNSYTEITLSHAAATPQMQYVYIYILMNDEYHFRKKNETLKHSI